jgi:hypothetical protein
MKIPPWLRPVVPAILLIVPLAASAEEGPRRTVAVTDDWQFRREGEESWRSVQVPAAQVAGEVFGPAGVGWYRAPLPEVDRTCDQRLLLYFHAVATEAEVWLGEHRLGSHLGGWTPFWFDVTDLLATGEGEAPPEIRIRVDVKADHNTGGFLPVVAPRFAGIWQPVELRTVPRSWIDTDALLAVGDPASGMLRLELPLHGDPLPAEAALCVRYRLRGSDLWRQCEVPITAEPGEEAAAVAGAWMERGRIHARVPVEDWQFWSPEQPVLYELVVELLEQDGAEDARLVDRVATRAAFRRIEVDGPRLLLNGRPLAVRGLLNWGYAPPLPGPSLDETWIRSEIELAQHRGFNLMKLCLWIPPRRYLELADELGMLVWMEYPTWNPQMTAEHLDDLRREYLEFYHVDRNHQSVILRSITCETGSGHAELEVIQALYDLAHAEIPQAVVVDDSSWIQWNRVHDFYDDHPYGNNHTWVATLRRLLRHIDEHGVKPLVLGEAIAADTYVDRAALLARVGDERPFWLPRHFDDLARWEAWLAGRFGPQAVARLAGDSHRYAHLMRKYQIEAFRREVPAGGYVVSVIRDIPLCSMGLMDYLDRPKLGPEEFAWHRDTMCLLRTPNDARAFAGGGALRGTVLVSHFGSRSPLEGRLRVRAQLDGSQAVLWDWQSPPLSLAAGELTEVHLLGVPLPAVAEPARLELHAEFIALSGEKSANAWTLWVVPAADPSAGGSVLRHASLAADRVPSWALELPAWQPDTPAAVVLASRFDEALLDHLLAGGRVVLVADGEPMSLPLADHWFLRGGPVPGDHPLLGNTVAAELLVDLQHFDLAGAVIPNVTPYVDQVDPFLLLWDTHDLDHVRTHGLAFESGIGEGRLLVTALRHAGAENAAGHWLLAEFIRHIAEGPAPRRHLAEETVHGIRDRLQEAQVSLVEPLWRFQPDPRDEGRAQRWHQADMDDGNWDAIHIGLHWEAQGYPVLDGWAWYRLPIEVPADWAGREVYLNVEGADDYYEVFVDGELAGSGGDLENRITAFEERKSHRLTDLVTPGQESLLAIRVFDWYGAGGLFRPITLSTTPFREGPVLLR